MQSSKKESNKESNKGVSEKKTNNEIEERPPQLRTTSIFDHEFLSNSENIENACEAKELGQNESIELNSLAGYPKAEMFHKKYKIGQKIGEGGNGTIFKCFRLKDNSERVVKIMEMDQQAAINFRKNYLSVRTLKNHQNIVKYNSIYLDKIQKRCYLVMEYYNFPNLRQKRAKSKFAEEQLKEIIKQILIGLKQLHKKNFIHRDIKPDNILYDRDSNRVVIVDLGVVKKVKSEKVEKVMSITGTPSYRAPEMSELTYKNKVDCWALGVTLYQLVTGYRPFGSFKKSMINKKESKSEQIPLKFEHPEWLQYSKHLQDLVKKLLTHNADKRISAKDALSHIWFLEQTVEIPENISKKDGEEKNISKSQISKSTHMQFKTLGNSTINNPQGNKLCDNNRLLPRADFVNSDEEVYQDEAI